MRKGLIVCILVLFFSCKDYTTDPSIKVFHYNQPQKITSLDPAFARSQNNMWAVHHIFNTLVHLDDSLNLRPSIAKSWNVSDNGKLYEFALRQDIKFHEDECFTDSNRNLTAEDVVFSFNRIIDDRINSPGSWIFKGKVRDVDPFVAVNDSTFQLHLKAPFLPMLNILSMQYCSVISQKALEYYGKEFRSHPIGTGPFKFKRWLENQGLYLIRNNDYFEVENGIQLPHLDGVRTSFIEDRKIAFLELLNSNVEAVNGLESSFINELLDKEGELLDKQKNKISFYKSPYLNFEYLGFNLDKISDNSPLAKKKFRQALNFAIDRETMMISLRNNIGSPADSGVIPRGLPSYNPEIVPGYNYDLKMAKNLLNESVIGPVEQLDPLIINTNKDYLDITTFVAKQWEQLGLKVRINLMESAALREGMRNGDLEIFRASWIADYPDGENFLSLFYGGNPAPPRYTRFQSDDFDLLYEQAIQETDFKSKIALYHKMNQIIVEDCPVVFLFYDESALFFSNKIENIRTNGLNLLQVKQLIEK